MKPKILDTIVAVGLLVAVYSGFAHTWQPVNNLDFGGLAVSADARIICAVPSADHPIISADSGQTWYKATNSPFTTGNHAQSVTMSADGSKIFVMFETNSPPDGDTNYIQDFISVTTDYGTNWLPTAFPAATSVFLFNGGYLTKITNTSYHLACSADGTKVVAAVENGPIYFSTDGGVSCQTSSVPAAAWTSVASSADGGTMVGALGGGSVYFSQDFGATWNPANLPAQLWTSVCLSADGKWVGAASSTGSYISSDAGVTWITNDISSRSISCSASGTNWTMVGEQVYISNDGATTWQTNFDAGGWWWSGVTSADGCAVTAMSWDLGILVGRLTPSPQLNIQPQDSAVKISWLLPSTNFVLQQTADLSNPTWTTVTTTPTLNFTNLNQQVSVPANGSNLFLRLTAQ